MIKLSSNQIKRVQSYLCMKGGGFKSCCDCPFFSNLKKCEQRKKVFPKSEIEEIANAWEVVKKEV